MAKRIKTEHVGAKNGGGYWGLRVDAKERSRKLRRSHDKEIVAEIDARETAGEEQSFDERSVTPPRTEGSGMGTWRDMPFSEAVTVSPRVQLVRIPFHPEHPSLR